MSLVANQIIHDLEERLSDNSDATLTSLSSNRQHKYFSSPAVISFKKINDNNATQIKIETIDRIGVLANIAKAFIDYKFKILSARIATAGEKAIDYFVISTAQDDALSDEQQNDLKQKLKELL